MWKKDDTSWCDVCGASENDGAVIQYYNGRALCNDCAHMEDYDRSRGSLDMNFLQESFNGKKSLKQLNNIKKVADGASKFLLEFEKNKKKFKQNDALDVLSEVEDYLSYVEPAIGHVGGVLRSVQDMIIAAKMIADFIDTNSNPDLKVLKNLAGKFDKKYQR